MPKVYTHIEILMQKSPVSLEVRVLFKLMLYILLSKLQARH